MPGMKPFYRGRNATLHRGDAVAMLEMLPESSVDLIFSDPPYKLSNGGSSCQAGRRVSVNKGRWDASGGFARDHAFHQRWIDACHRVLKENGSLWVSGTYHSIHVCGFVLQQQGWHLLNEICWYKPNATPHLACRMFTASHETLLWARKSRRARHVFNYEIVKQAQQNGDFLKRPNRQMRSVWAINTPGADEKKHGKHPTQKPESLLERIVVACTRPDDLVLDPFCGSATTGVAALRNGRRFVGIDNNTAYLRELAIKRLKEAQRQRSRARARATRGG